MGALLFWVPFHLTDGIIALIQPEEDQRSTYKILIGALAYFCWILSLAALSGWYWGGWTALAVVVVLPLWGLAGQWVRERWRGAWGDARRFFLLRSRQDLRSQLKEDQRNLANRLHQAFEAWRVPHKPVD
jgi:hypothetical protein